jgi:hypothetical protein
VIDWRKKRGSKISWHCPFKVMKIWLHLAAFNGVDAHHWFTLAIFAVSSSGACNGRAANSQPLSANGSARKVHFFHSFFYQEKKIAFQKSVPPPPPLSPVHSCFWWGHWDSSIVILLFFFSPSLPHCKQRELVTNMFLFILCLLFYSVNTHGEVFILFLCKLNTAQVVSTINFLKMAPNRVRLSHGLLSGVTSSQLTTWGKPVFRRANCSGVVLELRQSELSSPDCKLRWSSFRGNHAPGRTSCEILEACWRKLLPGKSCSCAITDWRHF